MLRHFLKKLVL